TRPATHGTGTANGKSHTRTTQTDPATTLPFAVTTTVPDLPVPLPDPLKPVRGKLKPSVPPEPSDSTTGG
ncbi:MAG TPA: hypothetical protein VIU44_05855, partial [Gaiellaceae bacterium]